MFDVITIGTATRDAFVKSREFKTVSSPEFQTGEAMCLPAGAKIDVDDIIFATGGGATNTAVTFARQGFSAACVCKIGDDISGREVLKDLRAEGVSTGYVIEEENAKTAYAILILSASGERTILVYRGASEDFKTSDINLRALEAKWFFISGSAPLAVISAVLDHAQKIKAKVAMNPSKNQIKLGLKSLGETLKKLDVVIMNREEGALLTGVDYKREEKIFSVLDEYVKGIIVLTDGPKGVLVSDGKNIYRAGTYKEKEIVDRTGAGDAFGSGFVSSLISNPGDIERAIKLASANATSVVESIGAKSGIITRDQLENDSRWKNLKIETRTIAD